MKTAGLIGLLFFVGIRWTKDYRISILKLLEENKPTAI